MAPPTMAWGPPAFFDVPTVGTIWGREFEVLPAGTMFAASVTLHGVIGVAAERDGPGRGRIRPGSNVLLYGARDTPTDALKPYEDELVEGFRAHCRSVS